MAEPDDKAFLKKYGTYKPQTTSVPVATIRPVISFESAEEADARRAAENRAAAGETREEERLRLAQEDAARNARGEGRDIESKTFDRGTKIIDQYYGRKPVQTFEAAWPAFTSAISQPNTTSGDRARIYNAIKVYDPDGAVPTGDIEGIESQSPIVQKIVRQFGRILDQGGTLPDQQRKELHEAMNQRIKTLRGPYDLVRRDFEARLQRNNLNPLEIGSPIYDADADIYQNYLSSLEAPAQDGEKGVVALRVAEGDRFATDKDIENASLMQGAWQSGKSIDELQALAKSLNLDPLSPKTIEALQADTNRKLIWTPSRSGIREGAEPQMGIGSAIGAGSIRGFTGNLAEEALSLVDAEAAAKLQAATDFAQQQRPYSGMGGEFIGSTLSPISRFLPGGPLTKDVLEGAIYGIGEGRPGTDLVERLKTGATGGLLQGGVGAAARRFMPGGATPEGAGIPQGEFVNVTGEVPTGMAPDMPMGGQAAPSPTGVDMPIGAPSGMAPPTAGMAPPTAGMAAPIAGEAVEDVAAEIGRDELIDLARKAVSRTPGASRARAQLAEIAKTNPEAKAAADRLGLDLPIDVLSDNSQLKAITGLTRSQIGSGAQTAWAQTYKEAADRGYQAMDELEAITDISQVSADVFNSIDNANKGLGTRAANLRDEVTGAIDSRGRVDVGSVKTWLQNRIDDLGGGKEGIANLSSEEKRLWATVSKANPTYAALNEQRDLIGQALEKTTGPWANSNTKKLKEIYGALANDQINFIESTAGKEIADKQRAANTLFKQMYEGREQMERLYGKNLSGSIAPLMQRAITEGGKGNVQSFNTLVKIIPEDMRGSVLSSALFKAAGTTDEKFSFTKFADLYKGLRDNSVVYKQFAQAVGPEGDKLLTDFYAISRRLSDADKAIQRTGASTQLDLLNSERLITQIVKSVGAGSAVAGVTSLVGGDIAVPVLGALATIAPQVASKYGKTNVEKLHNLMKSDEFRELAVSAATGDGLTKNINRVAGSKSFREYAKVANIDMKDARDWLNSAISKGATIAGTEAVGSKPAEAPTVEMPQ